jgi:alkylation response protein AidB-like acyl-CoA dehydrogenase
LLLFGTEEQKRVWLPDMVSGKKLSAFALTEPEAGSDAANVQTRATPTADGRGFLLNGEKRWITNGGIANVLTVMARTPVEGSGETKITAFIVTPDMPPEVVEKRMPAWAARALAFMKCSRRENILGELARPGCATVLDFGRTTFGPVAPAAAVLRRRREACETRVQLKAAGELNWSRRWPTCRPYLARVGTYKRPR